MPKFLLISGSPRKGNTDFILEKIYQAIKGKKELILLRNKEIKHCLGCATCDQTNRCVIHDAMDQISQKILKADVLIIGTPNYFDNVTGILKDFIDRTNHFYEGYLLKGKKLISIVVGGGKIKNSERVTKGALAYFANAHKLDYALAFCFQALKPDAVKNSNAAKKKIKTLIKKINALKF